MTTAGRERRSGYHRSSCDADTGHIGSRSAWQRDAPDYSKQSDRGATGITVETKTILRAPRTHMFSHTPYTHVYVSAVEICTSIYSTAILDCLAAPLRHENKLRCLSQSRTDGHYSQARTGRVSPSPFRLALPSVNPVPPLGRYFRGRARKRGLAQWTSTGRTARTPRARGCESRCRLKPRPRRQRCP